MPKGIDWINFIYINLGFISQVFAMYLLTGVSDIKKNWPKYRCNPMYMPLSDNIEKDFVYCVQNTQTSFMGYILQPINYILSNLSFVGGEMSDSLNYVRSIVSNIRSFVTNIVESIFGVFLNLIIEFQKITISIKDLVGKLIGVMVTMMYVLDGSIKTMKSTWNGPPGQMVRSLSGNCFHPDTNVKLKNGNIVKIKELNLGDILENGSRVNILMKLDNTENEKLYKIAGKGVNGEDIYVTGTHMVLCEKSEKFIEVKKLMNATEQNVIESNWFSCLITNDHLIKIGEHTFWDWEDDLLKYQTLL